MDRHMKYTTVIFDLGGVLVDWDPRYFYRKLFKDDEAAMEDFLTNICSPDWNLQQDGGRTFAEAAEILKHEHPGKTELIDAWLPGYPEMLKGLIPGTETILRDLHQRKVRTYALSNWSAETFHHALDRFDFFKYFHGRLISGDVQMLKPDPRIFQLLFERFHVEPSESIYVDDVLKNVEAARKLGMYGIHFESANALRQELAQLGLL
jgi:2-haloacid dehalogenase